MSKIAEIRETMAQARQAYSAAEKALQPDPNADPVTYLDQQWRQERAKYVGINQLDRPNTHAKPFLLITFFLVFLSVGLMLWREAVANSVTLLYVVAVFFMLTSLILLLGLGNAIRFALAERRYRKKRVSLVKHYGEPGNLAGLFISVRRLRYLWPKNSQSEAETRFHELQAEHYAAPKRDQAYHYQLQRYIDHAPERDQRYLTELAQLEQHWVEERFPYLNFNRKKHTYATPTHFDAWAVLAFGLGAIGFGVFQLSQGKPLSHTILYCVFGLVMVTGFGSMRQRASSLMKAEQRYFAQRQQLSHDYGRLI